MYILRPTHFRYLIAAGIAAVLSFIAIAAASAQTGVCPTGNALAVNPNGWVCITPAGDYNATTDPDGSGPQAAVPVVVRLDLLLFDPTKTNTGTDAPSSTISLGKPAINAQGAIWTQVPALLTLPNGQTHKARVVQVGQLGTNGNAQVSARSPESNPFLRPVLAPAPLAPTGLAVTPES